MYEQLNALSERLDSVRKDNMTEEATKTALVLPFIRELGYDIFNPSEVIPEFTADVGIKKGEKVDYAVCKDGNPIILIECKPCGALLDRYSSQLYRYFSTTNARIAILTDGVVYRFYSDLNKSNILDEKPFLVMNLDRISKDIADRIAPFCKDKFSLDAVLEDAAMLYAKSQIREHFAKEITSPSDEIVRHFTDRIHDGIMRQQVVDRYRPIVRAAMQEHIASAVESRLRSAIATATSPTQSEPDVQIESDDVITTEEELHGFYVVKAILGDKVNPSRVVARDVRSYFGILLDDNNRKPICRLHFNRSKKYLGVFDANKIETRIEVAGVNDLYAHAEMIRASLDHVMTE